MSGDTTQHQIGHFQRRTHKPYLARCLPYTAPGQKRAQKKETKFLFPGSMV